MSISPEIEYVDRSTESIRYLEHGWPSELCRWHSHEAYELHLILETQGKAFVGDYVGEFGPGSLFLTGPNLPHNWVTDKSHRGEVPERDMLVQFHEDNLETAMRAFPELRELRALLDASRQGIEFIGFDPMMAERHLTQIREVTGAGRILVFLRFLKILADHPQKTTLSVVKLTQAATSKKQQQIGEVVDHVVHNYSSDVSVAEAAKMAGMSEASFSRNFQAITGNRFTVFVRRIRIGQACVQLFETDEQISSICYGVGYQNLANFNRQFLKMKGVTPSEYRLAARNSLVSKSVSSERPRLQ